MKCVRSPWLLLFCLVWLPTVVARRKKLLLLPLLKLLPRPLLLLPRLLLLLKALLLLKVLLLRPLLLLKVPLLRPLLLLLPSKSALSFERRRADLRVGFSFFVLSAHLQHACHPVPVTLH